MWRSFEIRSHLHTKRDRISWPASAIPTMGWLIIWIFSDAFPTAYVMQTWMVVWFWQWRIVNEFEVSCSGQFKIYYIGLEKRSKPKKLLIHESCFPILHSNPGPLECEVRMLTILLRFNKMLLQRHLPVRTNKIPRNACSFSISIPINFSGFVNL